MNNLKSERGRVGIECLNWGVCHLFSSYVIVNFFQEVEQRRAWKNTGQRWSFQYLNRISFLYMKLYSGLSNFFREMFAIFNYFKTKAVKNFYFLGTKYQCTY